MSENNNAVETPKEPEAPAGETVVGIRFRQCGKVYTFKANELELAQGMRVVVESDMGMSLGHVAVPRHNVKKPKDKLKKVLRIATEKDLETVEKNRALEEEAKAFCTEKAREYKLDMKLVTTDTTLDKKRLTFYFTADGRIDFRELVRDLAAKFKTRIEMRQIGVRDEVKLLGGIGACGRQACCSLFLTSFAPITIRMAKQQELSINQSKLSGICGRLMCCLGYEYNESEKGKQHGRKKAGAALKGKTAEAETVAAEPYKAAEEKKTVPAVVPGKAPERKGKHDAAQVKEETAPSEGEKTVKDETREKKEGPARRRRRRRRRSRPDSQPREKQAGEKKEAPAKPQGGEQQTAEKKKGKPFSKRRKFWKKKKQ